jgi:hypothetical protein
MRQGRGTYRYANGDAYEGEWAAFAREGRGSYVYANGELFEGLWRSDKRDGAGVYLWTDGEAEASAPHACAAASS